MSTTIPPNEVQFVDKQGRIDWRWRRYLLDLDSRISGADDSALMESAGTVDSRATEARDAASIMESPTQRNMDQSEPLLVLDLPAGASLGLSEALLTVDSSLNRPSTVVLISDTLANQGNYPANAYPEGTLFLATDNIVFYRQLAGAWTAISQVNNTTYGVGWSGSNTIAPSRNAVYDKIEILTGGETAALVSDTVYGAGWNGVTTIAPSKNAVYDKIELITGATGSFTTVDLKTVTVTAGLVTAIV